jgi:hypothetical protein
MPKRKKSHRRGSRAKFTSQLRLSKQEIANGEMGFRNGVQKWGSMVCLPCGNSKVPMSQMGHERPIQGQAPSDFPPHSVDVAHGLALLFGIGTKPFQHGIRRRGGSISNGRPCREMIGRSKRTHDLTSSIVPRGTSFHRSVEFECSPIASAHLSCCCCAIPGPAELGAVNPDAVHHDRHTAGYGDDSAPHSPMACDLHAPALEP